MTPYPLDDRLSVNTKAIPARSWAPLLRETLQQQGYFHWKVEGHSMLPTLPPDATIEIHTINGAVRRGELLVFAGEEALVVHRLVGRRGDLMVLQGDNRAVPDAPVHPDHLIGRVMRGWNGSTLIYDNSRVNIIAFLWILRYHGLRILRFGIRHFRRRKIL